MINDAKSVHRNLKNPYLDAFRKTTGNEIYSVRSSMVRTYAWAIPSTEAVLAIAKLSPIVEMGAGTAYWASLIAQAGGSIECFDHHPPGPENMYGHKEGFHPVEPGKPGILKRYQDRTLMLCWPPYDSSMAVDCLEHWRGKHLVYIGEWEYGCCADEAFFARLRKEFREDRTIEIPQWYGIHDAVYIFSRKQARHPAGLVPCGVVASCLPRSPTPRFAFAPRSCSAPGLGIPPS